MHSFTVVTVFGLASLGSGTAIPQPQPFPSFALHNTAPPNHKTKGPTDKTGWTMPLEDTIDLPGDLFKSDPHAVAEAVAPIWYMDEDMCMPTAARQKDGSRTWGVHPVWGNENILNDGCEAPDMDRDEDATPNPFPSYWMLGHCAKDNSWRIVFDVYFVKDGGHVDDWEWAMVKFTQSDAKKDLWTRAGIWLEQDGKKPYLEWSKLSTFSDGDDIHDKKWGENKQHPRLWFGKWRHPVFPDPCLDLCDSDAFPLMGSFLDYRSSDFMYEARKWLQPASDLPGDWVWGSDADSYPGTFATGKLHDLCNL